MAHVLRSLPLTGEAWTGFQALDVGKVQLQLCCHLESEPVDARLLSQPFKQTNPYKSEASAHIVPSRFSDAQLPS